MKITITPGQAVTIHGWMKARTVLTWGDVLNNDKLTFAFLMGTCRLTEHQLHMLQPDLQAWIKYKRAFLEDSPWMTVWDVNPIQDFKADLADLIRMKWQSETLHKLGVTYEELVRLGLTHDTMLLFGLTLMGWSQVGFCRQHADAIPDSTLYKLFGMPKGSVLASLRSKV
jgi:hypothetical protein